MNPSNQQQRPPVAAINTSSQQQQEQQGNVADVAAAMMVDHHPPPDESAVGKAARTKIQQQKTETINTAEMTMTTTASTTITAQQQQQQPDNKAPPLPSMQDLQLLWTDVGNLYDKNQKVEWKAAVESLKSACEHLASSPEARQFAETYAGPILGVLADQHPLNLEPNDWMCVEDAAKYGCRLVVRDLEIRIQKQGGDDEQDEEEECFFYLPPLADKILPHLFGKYKWYFTKAAWANCPHVLLPNIEHFRTADGFRLWQQYYAYNMKNRAGSDSSLFPSLKTATLLLTALWESCSSSSSSTAATVASSVAAASQTSNTAREEEAIQFAKTVTDHLRHGTITMQSDNDLNNFLQSMRHMCDDLVDTRRNVTIEFYRYWRDLTKSMIFSSSLESQLEGWKQVLELTEAGAENRPPPQTFVVTGAGCKMVNGEYHFGGAVTADGYSAARPSADNDVKYLRTVPAQCDGTTDVPGEGSGDCGKKFTLFPCTMRGQQKRWFLSEADEEQPGTDRDIDYYQNMSKEQEEAYPPPTGWITCPGAGIDPPPTLQSVGVMVPPGQEGETLEHHLARWAIENEVLEHVLGDTTEVHGDIVAKSTILVKFLDSMRSMADKDLKDKICTLLNKLLWQAWEVSQQVPQPEIAKLFAVLLPMVGNDISLALIQTIRETYETWHTSDNGTQQLWAVTGVCASLASFIDPMSEQVTGLVDGGLAEEVRALVFMVALCPEIRSYGSAYAILYPFDRTPLDDGSDHREEEDTVTTSVRYAGMINLGSTGYMTVILQQLFMAPLVRNLILSLSDHDVSNSKFLEELRNMFHHLALAMQLPLPSEAQALQEVSDEALHVGLPLIRSFVELYDPSNFVDQYGKMLNLANDVGGQNNACKFYKQLLLHIRDQLEDRGSAAVLSLKKAFFVDFSHQQRCLRCEMSSSKGEEFLSIDCCINDASSLVDALDKKTKGEIMTGNTRVYCYTCGSRPNTLVKSGLSKIPEVVVFSLKRFILDPQTMELYKTDKKFAFEKLLCLYPYCQENDYQTKSLNYLLVGVVVHTGTANGGTYLSLIRERSGSKRWLQFSDEKVTVFAAEELAEVCFGGHVSEEAAKLGQLSQNATMLFYERVQPKNNG